MVAFQERAPPFVLSDTAAKGSLALETLEMMVLNLSNAAILFIE